MKGFTMVALALLTLAGCKSQPGPPVESVQVQPQPAQSYSEGRRSDSDESRHEDRGGRRGRRSHRGGNTQADDTPGAFDFYLLNLSWSPEFCLAHADAAECAAHPAFVLHGLWPQNNDGSYPEHCADAPGPANPAAYRDIYPDAGLLAHEWQTHGTCSGLAADAYFSTERQAVRSVRIPRELAAVQASLQLTPQQIIADFAQSNPSFAPDSFAMSCGNNRLTAVEVCLSKDLHAVSCSSVRSCRANVVKVTPPGATGD